MSLWPAFISQHSLLWQAGYLTGWGAGTTLVMASAEPSQQGSTQGLLSVMQALFNSVMPAVGGAVWNSTLFLSSALHPHVCFGYIAVLGMVMVWLGFKLPRSPGGGKP